MSSEALPAPEPPPERRSLAARMLDPGPAETQIVDPELSVRERMFVHYFVGPAKFNATMALRMAGYTGTQGALEVTASRLMGRPTVRFLIDERIGQQITREETLEHLVQIIRGSAEDFFTPDPDGGPPQLDLRRAFANGKFALIKKLGRDKDGNPTLEFYDRLKAIELLGKHLRLWGDKADDEDALAAIDWGKVTTEQLLALRKGKKI